MRSHGIGLTSVWTGITTFSWVRLAIFALRVRVILGLKKKERNLNDIWRNQWSDVLSATLIQRVPSYYRIFVNSTLSCLNVVPFLCLSSSSRIHLVSAEPSRPSPVTAFTMEYLAKTEKRVCSNCSTPVSTATSLPPLTCSIWLLHIRCYRVYFIFCFDADALLVMERVQHTSCALHPCIPTCHFYCYFVFKGELLTMCNKMLDVILWNKWGSCVLSDWGVWSGVEGNGTKKHVESPSFIDMTHYAVTVRSSIRRAPYYWREMKPLPCTVAACAITQLWERSRPSVYSLSSRSLLLPFLRFLFPQQLEKIHHYAQAKTRLCTWVSRWRTSRLGYCYVIPVGLQQRDKLWHKFLQSRKRSHSRCWLSGIKLSYCSRQSCVGINGWFLNATITITITIRNSTCCPYSDPEQRVLSLMLHLIYRIAYYCVSHRMDY